MSFKQYLEPINESENPTWTDCENATEYFWYKVEQMAKKEKEILDVKRTGASNGFHVKFRNGAVAHITLDPQNKF